MSLPTTIESERLSIQALYPPTFQMAIEHYTTIHKSRYMLREWLAWVDRTRSPEIVYKDYLLDHCQKNWKNREGYAYRICRKSDNVIVGAIDFFGIDPKAKSGEIGFWLAEDAVGKGYMSEALATLEATIFNHGYNRIIIKNDTLNERSVHVAQRAGYHLDGVLRQESWDSFHRRLRDTNVFSKLKFEWQAQRS